MAKDFTGKVAFVTGAASGIGEAVATQLAERGAKVVVADLKLDAANRVVEGIKAKGGEAAAVAVDVGDAAQVEKAVQFATDTFGKLDLAVNNAGIGGAAAPLGDYTLEDWHKVIDVNLNSVFYSMKYEIAAMLKSGGGAFVNPETRALVRAGAVSVWLKADIDILFERVSRRSNRPLLKTADPRATLEKLIAERYPIYAQADVTVISRDVPQDNVAGDVVAALLDHLKT